jgi:hypothetical protein
MAQSQEHMPGFLYVNELEPLFFEKYDPSTGDPIMYCQFLFDHFELLLQEFMPKPIPDWLQEVDHGHRKARFSMSYVQKMVIEMLMPHLKALKTDTNSVTNMMDVHGLIPLLVQITQMITPTINKFNQQSSRSSTDTKIVSILMDFLARIQEILPYLQILADSS